MTEDRLPVTARRYQWYLGYDDHDEYAYDPEWVSSLREQTEDAEDEFGNQYVTFFDVDESETEWISASRVYSLTEMI